MRPQKRLKHAPDNSNDTIMKASTWISWALIALVAAAVKVRAAEESNSLPPPLKKFVVAKTKQIHRAAERFGVEVPPEVEDYLKAAQSGDWMQALGMYSTVRNSWPDPEDPDLKNLKSIAGPCILEIQLALEQIMDTDPDLALKLGDSLMASVPRGAIYFGGTDPGRGLPTALSASHENGDPFYTITQNGLADGTYLNYLREIYGRANYIPSSDDSQKAFQDYLSDAQRRLEHDRDHPKEPRQLKPGEDVRMNKNRVTVSGQVAVMAINGLLAKVIFDQNPDRQFFVEESFPLDWMYPHLAPHGLIMRLHREPLAEISAAEVEKDLAYWKKQLASLVGDWVKPETTLDEISRFVRKRYLDHNLAGFEGNEKYLQNEKIRKAYGKLRSSIAGVYAWQAAQAKDPKSKARMKQAAEAAFKQALVLSPESPEAVFRFVNLLLEDKRKTDGLKIAELAADVDPGSDSFANLVTSLKQPEIKSP